MNRGIFFAASAYLLWGFLPVYWKALQAMPAMHILSHRVVWSAFFLSILIALRTGWSQLKEILATPRNRLIVFLAACLLAVNWLTYIWGVNAGFIVETSLGYFINPLVNVMLGVIFLREKLRAMQWFPIGLATLGVLYLTVSYGALPWIALVLAFSFGLYGLAKKTAPIGALHGLTLETFFLFIPALLFLIYKEIQGAGAFGNLGATTSTLLILSGVVTTLPLLLFGMAARRIHLSTLGLLQYIAPTCQFFLGVYVYGEPFTQERLVGFSFIWIALAFYTLEGVFIWRRAKPSTVV